MHKPEEDVSEDDDKEEHWRDRPREVPKIRDYARMREG